MSVKRNAVHTPETEREAETERELTDDEIGSNVGGAAAPGRPTFIHAKWAMTD